MGKLKLAVLFFLLFTCLPHNTVLAQLSSKEVDKLVNNAMQKFNVAGVAVAIVKDGKPIHAKGYGVKSVDTKAKVDEHTLFAIASNSICPPSDNSLYLPTTTVISSPKRSSRRLTLPPPPASPTFHIRLPSFGSPVSDAFGSQGI